MSEAHMNDPENADLSRAYAATARDEPSAALDGAIVAKARSAAETRPGTRTSSRHWRQLVAVAATLVITASLVVLMQSEQPQIGALGPPARDAALTPAAKLPTEAVQAAEVAPPEVAQREEKPRSRGKVDVSARDQPSGQASQEPGQPAAAQPVLADAAKAAVSAPDRQAFPAARSADDARASAAAPAAPTALARADAGLQRPGAAATASSASGAAPAERRSLQAAESVARSLVDSGAAKKDETPEAWLARIAELRKQGRIKEADESFAEFRKRYPDYPIPAAKAETSKSDK